MAKIGLLVFSSSLPCYILLWSLWPIPSSCLSRRPRTCVYSSLALGPHIKAMGKTCWFFLNPFSKIYMFSLSVCIFKIHVTAWSLKFLFLYSNKSCLTLFTPSNARLFFPYKALAWCYAFSPTFFSVASNSSVCSLHFLSSSPTYQLTFFLQPWALTYTYVNIPTFYIFHSILYFLQYVYSLRKSKKSVKLTYLLSRHFMTFSFSA